MTYEEKMEAVLRCIEMIPKHGSISVRHVCGDTELNISSDERIFANYRSIAGLMTVTYGDKYLNELVVDENGKQVDYNILLNPNRKKGFWAKNPFYEKLVIAIVSGGISLMVGLTISKQSKQSQNLIDKRLDSLIKDISVKKIEKK
jgi:hypothetical protein